MMDWDDYLQETKEDFENELYGSNHYDLTCAEQSFEIFENAIKSGDEDNWIADPDTTAQDVKDILYDYEVEERAETTFDEDIWDAVYDLVTGNNNGTKTYSRAQAEENIKGVLYDVRFHEQLEDFDMDVSQVLTDPENVDVLARCATIDEQRWDIEQSFMKEVQARFVDIFNEKRCELKLQPIKVEM